MQEIQGLPAIDDDADWEAEIQDSWESQFQYVSSADGTPKAVIVPIEVWKEIRSELETTFVLGTEAMRKRLEEARSRRDDIPLEEVRARLGI